MDSTAEMDKTITFLKKCDKKIMQTKHWKRINPAGDGDANG